MVRLKHLTDAVLVDAVRTIGMLHVRNIVVTGHHATGYSFGHVFLCQLRIYLSDAHGQPQHQGVGKLLPLGQIALKHEVLHSTRTKVFQGRVKGLSGFVQLLKHIAVDVGLRIKRRAVVKIIKPPPRLKIRNIAVHIRQAVHA